MYIKSEGDKFHSREKYIITSWSGKYAILQKLTGTRFASRQYKVPSTDIFPIMSNQVKPSAIVSPRTPISSRSPAIQLKPTLPANQLINDSSDESTGDELHDQAIAPGANAIINDNDTDEEQQDTDQSDQENENLVTSSSDEQYYSDAEQEVVMPVLPPQRPPRPQREKKKPPWHSYYVPH